MAKDTTKTKKKVEEYPTANAQNRKAIKHLEDVILEKERPYFDEDVTDIVRFIHATKGKK